MASDGTFGQVDPSSPAVVFKLDRNVFHHGGLGVVRTLGRLGVQVHVVCEDVLAPVAVSRYVHGRWRWSPDHDRPARIQHGLMRLAERIGRPAVLVATDDAAAIYLAEHGDALRPWFLFPAPERDLPRRVADKESLVELCRSSPISCPQTVAPTCCDEAMAFVERVGLPVFVKLARPWQTPARRARSTTLLSTAGEVAALFDGRARDVPGGLLLQEAVVGGPDWIFHGYCDTDSTCRPGFTGVKERSYPPHAGLTTLGRAATDERLRDDVVRLLRHLRYRGPVDLDLRRDARDGRYRLLDFNPRLGAQFRLFEDEAGLDVARAAYLDLTGQPIPDQTSTPARRFVVENYDLLAAFGYRRRRELDLASWARSLRGVAETAWFARDDLVPFGLMCLRFGWRAIERPLRRGARSPSGQPPRYRRGRASRGAGAAVAGGQYGGAAWM